MHSSEPRWRWWRRGATIVAAALIYAGWGGTAMADVLIEGFVAAAPPDGAAVPDPVAGPDGRLADCDRADALTVVFTYAGLAATDTLRVDWWRGDMLVVTGAELTVAGSVGRAYRSVSPIVADGRYTAEILVNGVYAASADVVKACRVRAAPPPTPRVAGRYRITLTPLNISARNFTATRRITPLCRAGACDVRLTLYERTRRVRFNGARYRVVIGNASRADCGSQSDGSVVARDAYRVQATVIWRVVGKRFIGGQLVATQLRGRVTEQFIPNGRGRAHNCRPSSWTWRLDAYRVGG